MASLIAAPSAMPLKIHPLADEPPTVARSTSAQAVPSGYGSSSWLCTISSRRSGIIAASPSTAPRKQSATTCRYGGTMSHMNSAGMVKIVPLASDVEADPMVCDRLASRIVPRARKSRNNATVMTAAGIDAETVRPTRRPR